MGTLVKGSVPLYAQLEAAIRESIRRNLWGPGEPLPPDREMARRWGVSRCTVRQALDVLVRDGLIERRQGKGTFVVLSESLRDFIGYYAFEAGEDEVVRFTTKVISFGTVDPPQRVRDALGVTPGVQVLKLKLLRVANETPAILLTAFMPAEACSALREEDILAFPTLTQVITARCGIPVVSQRRAVRPTLIEGEEASLLQVQPGVLGLRMERVSYADFRRPVEYGTTVVRGDVVTYSLNVGRAGHDVSQALHYRASPRPSAPSAPSI